MLCIFGMVEIIEVAQPGQQTPSVGSFPNTVFNSGPCNPEVLLNILCASSRRESFKSKDFIQEESPSYSNDLDSTISSPTLTSPQLTKAMLFSRSLFALAALLSATAISASPSKRAAGDIFDPMVLTPNAQEGWVIGTQANVTWDTSNAPENISNESLVALAKGGRTLASGPGSTSKSNIDYDLER